MSKSIISVEGLGKKYTIGERVAYRTFRDSFAKGFNISLQLARLKKRQEKNNYFWALRDVSFEVGTGEIIGIVGRNGAGKSTLLKILSRITQPTEGRAKIHGRVGALLEVATGFHPELTGRENVYLNGAILGMKKKEIDKKFDAIVDFSEIEKFIDTPVKRYSTGMYVRLAFAVAAHLEPEILIVDEVLAVGDASFQRKCLGKMNEESASGRTVLLVSHNMAAIKSLASKAIWLEDGQIKNIGQSQDIVNQYLSRPDAEGFYDSEYLESNRLRLPKYQSQMKLVSVRVKDANARTSGVHFENSDMSLEIQFSSKIQAEAFEVFVRVRTTDGQLVFTCLPGKSNTEIGPGVYLATVNFNLAPLLPGLYQGDVVLLSNVPQDSVCPAFQFEILADTKRGEEYRTTLFSSGVQSSESAHSALGLIRVKASWADIQQMESR